MRRRACWVASALVVGAGLMMAAPGVAFGDPASTPSLSGESLSSAADQVETHCNADGTGYYVFSTSGQATGPYTGTFSEKGVLAVTQRDGLYYEHFGAVYTIHSVSPEARIWGFKAEIPPETVPPPPGFTCQDYTTEQPGYTDAFNSAPDTYRAIIWRMGRAFTDRGTTEVFVGFVPGFGLNETFTSSYGASLSEPGWGDSGR